MTFMHWPLPIPLSAIFILSKKSKDCIVIWSVQESWWLLEYTELHFKNIFYGMYIIRIGEEIKALEAYLESLDAAEKCQNLTLMSAHITILRHALN